MTNPSITTPCHGAALLILTTQEGSGHLASDVPSEIMCAAEGCFNTWSPTGAADEWNVDEWCRDDECRHRYWTSGSAPTHKRGAECPPVTRPTS